MYLNKQISHPLTVDYHNVTFYDFSTKSQHTHYKEFQKINDNYSIVNKYIAKNTPF